MANVTGLSPAYQLALAIQSMAERRIDTQQEISAGISAMSQSRFTDSPEYRRLANRRRWQRKAMDRLIYALARMAP